MTRFFVVCEQDHLCGLTKLSEQRDRRRGARIFEMHQQIVGDERQGFGLRV
jgi:hypothetical protein